MKTWIKNTIAGAVLVVGVGGNVAYTEFISPYLDDETVYVASHNLTVNQPITQSDIRAVRVNKDLVVEPTANYTQLLGLYTSQPVQQNQQITSAAVEQNPLAITPGTQDVPLQQGWIAAMPQSLRQGDYVELVPLPQKTNEIAPTQSNNITVPNVTSSHVPQNSSKQVLQNTVNDLINIPVLYVRTDNNQEVTNASPTGAGTIGSRDNGSGTPSFLELKLTNSQAQEVKNDIEQGDQFYVWLENNIPSQGNKE